MKAARSFLFKVSTVGELLSFLCARKLWWMIPIVFDFYPGLSYRSVHLHPFLGRLYCNGSGSTHFLVRE